MIVGLAKRFSNPLVLILLFAAGIAALTHEHASFLIITAIVVLSVIIDFVQEHRAENAAKRCVDGFCDHLTIAFVLT